MSRNTVAYDKNGQPIKVGDEVRIVAEITDITERKTVTKGIAGVALHNTLVLKTKEVLFKEASL